MVADALSRNLAELEAESPCLNALTSSTMRPDWIAQLEDSYSGDKDCQELILKQVLEPTAVSIYQYDAGLLRRKGKLYVGSSNSLRQHIIDHFHSSPLGDTRGNMPVYKGLSLFYIGRV